MSAAKKNPTRLALIKKVHVAARQLALTDDCYRSVLARATGGKASTKAMNIIELEAVVREFRRLGWKDQPARKAGSRPQADTEQARKVRALWLALADMGVLRDASEAALALWVKRQTGVDALQWLGPEELNQVIEALKSWVARERAKRGAGR